MFENCAEYFTKSPKYYIFQIHTSVSGQIMWRELSCFCRNPDPCTCFSPQCVTFPCASEPSTGALHQHHLSFQDVNAIKTISDVNEGLIGKWCVVVYDNDPYPGIIQDVDTQVVLWSKQCTGLGPIGFSGQWRMMWSGTLMRMLLGLCQNHNQWQQDTWSLLTQFGRNSVLVLISYLYMYQKPKC